MAPNLPDEMWQEICEIGWLKGFELATMASVSRKFAEIARPVLYRSVKLQMGTRASTRDTLELLASNRQLAKAVVSLSLLGFWSCEAEHEPLVSLLSVVLENMVSLCEVKAMGNIFANSKERTSFFDILSGLEQLRKLKIWSDVGEVEGRSLGAFKLSDLVVKEWTTVIPTNLVRQILQSSHLHLVNLTLPFKFNYRLEWPFWDMEFPNLETLSLPTGMQGEDCVEPPQGEVSRFLQKHVGKLEYIEHTGFYSLGIHSPKETPGCRIRLAPLKGGEGLADVGPEFVARQMDTRLEIACRLAIRCPVFLSKGLESLTLEYRERDHGSTDLSRLLWRLFMGTRVYFPMQATSLHTLNCRFDHPQELETAGRKRYHVQKILGVVRGMGSICGQSLRRLSGMLPPLAIPAETLALALSGFPNLTTLGIYDLTIGSQEELERREYTLQLRVACPRLERVEIFTWNNGEDTSPKWVVDLV